ncbi:hypothetical protein Pmani_034566 [Petrolisthes manimaculis]|uniref:Uncharacterized protein n=1 Tax=Petrolisthes manimaculis TaxID=1843537 RepID=A0AAE1NP39_9EUCA|nr:hypothetical protein Pmani_034566 [Petrolisthes manimaculis]
MLSSLHLATPTPSLQSPTHLRAHSLSGLGVRLIGWTEGLASEWEKAWKNLDCKYMLMKCMNRMGMMTGWTGLRLDGSSWERVGKVD